MAEKLGKIIPVARCDAVEKCLSSPKHYASKMNSGYRTTTNKQIATEALRRLEEARKADVDTHAANEQALATNAVIRNRIISLMEEIGMPKTYRVQDKKSRSRYVKWMTLDAGYLADLKREVPVSDGFDLATSRYNALLAEYEKFAGEAEKEHEQAKQASERAAEAERNARIANIELAKIIIRWGLPEHSTWSDVLDELRKKDQRLDLAVAMQQTRGDWTEGFWRVSDAIDRFKIYTDQDKEIANDILGCLKSECGDGRIFRDTTWNYGRLFAEAADKQLSADVQSAYGHVEC